MNTAEQPVITSEAVAAWMKQQLANVHESSPYGNITVEISHYKGYDTIAKFSIYDGRNHVRDAESMEDAFSRLAKITPQYIAAAKREQAEKLLAEAEELEQSI